MTSVWAAMSGGVDSSVAAARLAQTGHRVLGVTMRLLPGENQVAPRSDDAVRNAALVCEHLGIQHRVLDLRAEFTQCVIQPFVSAYRAGRTPNPCVLCNERLKFTTLLEHMRTNGGDALATGHYARVVTDPDGADWLEKGRDRGKDQSYFLYRLTEPVLQQVLFPLGEATKEEVRKHARELGLPTSERRESQEICFVDETAGRFVEGWTGVAGAKGPIVDKEGRRLGLHKGIAHYTLGQRKGLGLSGGPWYVHDICAETNSIVVSTEGPATVTRIDLGEVVWRLGDRAEVNAVTRYRSAETPAEVIRTQTGLSVKLSSPVPRVASGQAVVCYVGDRVVGGGVVNAG